MLIRRGVLVGIFFFNRLGRSLASGFASVSFFDTKASKVAWKLQVPDGKTSCVTRRKRTRAREGGSMGPALLLLLNAIQEDTRPGLLCC